MQIVSDVLEETRHEILVMNSKISPEFLEQVTKCFFHTREITWQTFCLFFIISVHNNHACSKFRSSQVSVKKHGPSNKEIIEKKIRKKDNRKKYVDIERDMINISHSEYIVKYFGYLEDQVWID